MIEAVPCGCTVAEGAPGSRSREGRGIDVQGGTEMGQNRGDARRMVRRVITALAVSDLAYRMFMRETVRRALGMEVKASG